VLAVGVTVPTVFIWRGCTVDAEVYLSGHQTGDDYDCAMELRLRDIPPELEEWIISEAFKQIEEQAIEAAKNP
jgi:hypothetical protein